jgi:cytidylate kinase
MYRAATWLAVERGVDLTDAEAVAELVAAADMDIQLDPAESSISIEGTDVTEAIRAPEVSAAVSSIATNLDVRADLIVRQRRLIACATRGIVVEGRDITTVVAPDASVRVLLVADPAARVARRHAELGEHIDSADVTDQVIRRDQDDSAVAQFHSAAPGVVVVDSTDLTLEQVIDAICELVPVGARRDQLP